MPIYSKDGNVLSSAFSINGSALVQAYDINGNPLIDDGTVNIMTFNIERWRDINADTTIMNSIFNAYQPILFCGIQETGNDGTLKYVGSQFQTGKAMESASVTNKPAILFNTSYEDYEDVLYETQSYELRGYQKCYVTINGKRVAVFNTHLQNDQPNIRIPQALELLEVLKDEEYFIATGDFNFGGTSFSDQQYTTMVIPFINEGFNMANWTQETGLVNTWFDGTTVDGSTYKYATDNIITSSNIDINSITYDQRKITAQTGKVIDHIPIVVNVTIN